MASQNPNLPCPLGCGRFFGSNNIPRHVRRCLGASPAIEDLCRVGDVEVGDGCWAWRATCQAGDPARYGLLSTAAHKRFGERYAHRLALILDGRPPGERYALHRCDNPPCIRPDHLYVGTPSDNMRDAVKGGHSPLFAVWSEEERTRAMTKRATNYPPYENRLCIICGVEFRVRSDKTQRSCSTQCAHVATWRTRRASAR